MTKNPIFNLIRASDDLKANSKHCPTLSERFRESILKEIDPEGNLNPEVATLRVDTFVNTHKKTLIITPTSFVVQRYMEYDYLPGKSTASHLVEAFNESITDPSFQITNWFLFQKGRDEPLDPNNPITDTSHLIIKNNIEVNVRKLNPPEQDIYDNPQATVDLNKIINKQYPPKYHARLLGAIQRNLSMSNLTTKVVLDYLIDHKKDWTFHPLLIKSNRIESAPIPLLYIPGITTVQDLLEEYREKHNLDPNIECKFFAPWISMSVPLNPSDIVTEDYKEYNSCLIITKM